MPKLEDSEVTMEARLTNDPEIEVRTKLVSWQINIDPRRSPHANLEVPGLNNLLVLS